MRRLGSPHRIWLVALNATLLGVLIGAICSRSQVFIPPSQSVNLSTLLADKPVPPLAADATLGDTYALLIGQPLFQADRKYTPPPKADTAVAQSPPPDFNVTGYLEIPGRPAKAFLRERSGGRTLAVAMGDSVEGWTVVDLKVKQVSLRQGDRTAELTRSGAPIANTPDAVPAASTAQQAPARSEPPNVIIPSAAAPNPVMPAGEANTASPTQKSAFSSAPSITDHDQTGVPTLLPVVTVTARKLVLSPAPLPAPLGPPRTFSAPTEPAAN